MESRSIRVKEIHNALTEGLDVSEAFAQHLAKKLGAGTMVTASYQLPSEPRLLHDVVQKKVAEMLLPLVSPPAC